MMIVVAIIAGTALLAVPAVQSATANRKVNRAALDVVRLARRARAESVGFGRAHLLAWNPGNDGSLVLWRGSNNGCNTNAWPVIQGAPCGAANSMCVDQVQLSDGRYRRGTHQVRMAWSAASVAPVDLCYEPTGALFYRTAAGGRFTDRNVDPGGAPIGGAFELRFDRISGGAVTGVPRFVVFPLGGDARVHNRVGP